MDCPLCSKCVELVTLACNHRCCYRCLRGHWTLNNLAGCPICAIKPSLSSALNKRSDLSKRETKGSDEQTGEMGKCQLKTHKSDIVEPDPFPGVACDESEDKRLKEKKERLELTRKLHESLLEHIEAQMLYCEAEIRKKFRFFHEILKQEEEFCLCELRNEQQQKTEMIKEELKKLEDKLRLSDSNYCAEQQLQGQSTESSSDMKSMVLTDEPQPQLKSGLLIDQAGILGNLCFKVWEILKKTVTYSPIVLDPNTAHRELCLSEDLASVRKAETLQQVPLNPERSTGYLSVMGSEGFSSGWHCWDVMVGDYPDWTIGLVKESADRRARCEALPQHGFWCLTYRDKQYTNIKGKNVELEKNLTNIRVILDIDIGKVSFYDTEKMTLICYHHEAFTERVFPYFCLGGAEEANVTKSIKIAQSFALSYVKELAH